MPKPTGLISILSGIRAQGRRPAARSFVWLAGDKVLRLCLGVVVGSWIARHLGDQQLGVMAYLLAWVTLLSSVAGLGMENLLVRNITRSPERAGQLLFTVATVRSLVTFGIGLLLVGVVSSLRPSDPDVWVMMLFLVGGTTLQSLESCEAWFQATSTVRAVIIPRLAFFLSANALKIYLLSRGAALVDFIALTALEMAAGGLLTAILAKVAIRNSSKFEFIPLLARSLLRESWPLAVSGLFVALYMRLGLLMLSQFLGDKAVGVFAAATRISESGYIVPAILATSILPSLLHALGVGDATYREARLRYFRISALFGYGISGLLCLSAPLAIDFLYGALFRESAAVLMVHSWTIVFAFMGVARGQHLLNKRLTKVSLTFTVWGVVTNLLFSVLLIPKFGALGAAWATVLAYSVSSLFASFFYKATREIGREQLLALLTPWRISMRMDPS